MKHLLLSATVFVASASISVAQNIEQLFFDTDGGICNFQGDVSVFGQEGLFISISEAHQLRRGPSEGEIEKIRHLSNGLIQYIVKPYAELQAPVDFRFYITLDPKAGVAAPYLIDNLVWQEGDTEILKMHPCELGAEYHEGM